MNECAIVSKYILTLNFLIQHRVQIYNHVQIPNKFIFWILQIIDKAKSASSPRKEGGWAIDRDRIG